MNNSDFNNANDRKKRNKKILVRVICIVIATMIAMMIISFGINKYLDKKEAEENANNVKFNFSPADYDENIFEDPEYMSLIKNEFIYYTDYATNLTLGIDRESAKDHGSDVTFMVEYIYSIIGGDADSYNGFFSDIYYKSNDKKERFTMQKLYEVNIAKVYETEKEDNNGENYTEYQYIVKYRILDNNGTFRSDFNTGTKEQYIFFSNRTGELLIDDISTPKTKSQK